MFFWTDTFLESVQVIGSKAVKRALSLFPEEEDLLNLFLVFSCKNVVMVTKDFHIPIVM